MKKVNCIIICLLILSGCLNNHESITSSKFNTLNSSSENLSISTSNSFLSNFSTNNLFIYTFIGRIEDELGNGMQNITINLEKENENIMITKTDNGGNFKFEQVEKGIYSLSFVLNDSNYEIVGNHSNINIEGDNAIYVYQTIILKKKNIIWGELS